MGEYSEPAGLCQDYWLKRGNLAEARFALVLGDVREAEEAGKADRPNFWSK